MSDTDLLAKVESLVAAKHGDRKIAELLNQEQGPDKPQITRHQVRNMMREVERAAYMKRDTVEAPPGWTGKNLQFHPFADIFPLIEGDDFAALVADVKANGLHQQIDIYQGKILDGRNRYRACVAAEVELAARYIRYFRPELHGDPLDYVMSQNLQRRHLNDDQRRVVAAKVANLRPGRPSAENPADCGVKIADAAKMANTDEAGTERARTVIARASPEVVKAVEKGKLSVNAALQASKLSPAVQLSISEMALAGRSNAMRTALKQATREVRERALADKQTALPTRRYGVILADPEWRFEPWSRETGLDRSPDNHYPTSCTEVIAGRDVGSISAKDCILFLWATAPMLPHALVVMAAWGFDYRSHFVWAKNRWGTGYWNRNKHELLLIGIKGDIPAPAQGQQRPSVIEAEVGAHSAKPECVLEMIEEMFPNLPKIELNRRGPPRLGWDAWGNESEPSHQSEPAASSSPETAAEGPATDHPMLTPSPADPSSPHPLDIPVCLRRNP